MNRSGAARLLVNVGATLAAAWAGALVVNRSLRRITGPSMEPTLAPGDLVVTAPPALVGGLQRDDIVVADTLRGAVVKRLAGHPGEPVLVYEGVRHAGGRWYRTRMRTPAHRFHPGPGEVVLLGDNVAASTDSRTYGTLPATAIRRVVLGRLDPWQWLRGGVGLEPFRGTFHRPTVRVVCLGPDGRVLLFHVRDMDDETNSWWEIPGGGIEPGEDVPTAARRELAEELGHTNLPLADLGLTQARTVTRSGARFVKVEHLLAARLPDASVSSDGWTESEHRENIEWRWWTPEELATTNATILPTALPDLLPTAHQALP